MTLAASDEQLNCSWDPLLAYKIRKVLTGLAVVVHTFNPGT